MVNKSIEKIIGYLCATAIVITMLLTDGITAQAAATAVAAGVAGVTGYSVGTLKSGKVK